MEIIGKYLTDKIHGTLFILNSHILNCVPIGENMTDSKKDVLIQDIPSIKRLLQQCEELKSNCGGALTQQSCEVCKAPPHKDGANPI
jgi:hypothetical protein